MKNYIYCIIIRVEVPESQQQGRKNNWYSFSKQIQTVGWLCRL